MTYAGIEYSPWSLFQRVPQDFFVGHGDQMATRAIVMQHKTQRLCSTFARSIVIKPAANAFLSAA